MACGIANIIQILDEMYSAQREINCHTKLWAEKYSQCMNILNRFV